jgi:hypothetical protein
VDVDAVHHRAADALLVLGHGGMGAAAWPVRIARIAAGAGMHTIAHFLR